MTVLPMFPLTSVLVPGMPLRLHVFEPRYLQLLRDVWPSPGEFGVVLIERGQEVGGSDQRFSMGTVARIGGLTGSGEDLDLAALGDRRLRVLRWLPDDPYPAAEVEYLPEPAWSDADAPLLTRAEKTVRRALAVASEFTDTDWPATVTLPGSGVDLAWRLAGVAPIGPLDRHALLSCVDAVDLLTRLIQATEEAVNALTGPTTEA